MSPLNPKYSAAQAREYRMTLVSQCVRKGMSLRKIQAELMPLLGKKMSITQIRDDVQKLIKEWRQMRFTDMDEVKTVELQKIDFMREELLDQWEMSKKPYKRKVQKQKGEMHNPVLKEGELPSDLKSSEVIATGVEKTVYEIVRLGDPRYMAEIRALDVEARKIMGVYEPEKEGPGITVNVNITPEDVKSFAQAFNEKY